MASKGAHQVDQYMRTPDDLTGWEAFKRFLWNPQTGEFCGRTGSSWFKIIVFYIALYVFLAAFWGLMLFVFFKTMDDHVPKWTLSESLIGTNPGLGFRPLPKEEDSTLIWVRNGVANEWEHWVKNLEDFLKKYEKDERNAEVEQFNLKDIDRSCSKDNNFGYISGQPCVLIKLNRIFGWIPEPYNNDSIPEELREKLKTEKGEVYDGSSVYITCEGENPADKESIGPVHYYPEWKLSAKYYPFKNQKGYQSPFVFVRFEKPTPGVPINVECRAWAANIKYDRADRIGNVHFELLVDEVKKA